MACMARDRIYFPGGFLFVFFPLFSLCPHFLSLLWLHLISRHHTHAYASTSIFPLFESTLGVGEGGLAITASIINCYVMPRYEETKRNRGKAANKITALGNMALGVGGLLRSGRLESVWIVGGARSRAPVTTGFTCSYRSLGVCCFGA